VVRRLCIVEHGNSCAIDRPNKFLYNSIGVQEARPVKDVKDHKLYYISTVKK